MSKARDVRELCMDAAAEGDDELLEKYLNGDELTLEELTFSSFGRKASARMTSIPIFLPYWT